MNDSYYYQNSDGQVTGPVSIDELRQFLHGGTITPDTLVWKEGAPDWQPLRLALVNENPPVPAPSQQRPPMPDTHLLSSILVTLFCCMPFGIIAIIKSAQVESLHYKGLYNEAQRASAEAARWSMWGFLCILIPVAIYVMGLLAVLLIKGL